LRDSVVTFIQQNYQDINLCADMIAEHFHRNTAYISRFFKEQTGCSIGEYINRYRIDHAKELMSDTSARIRVVAKSVGYSGSNAFIRAFKKFEGITPGQFKVMN
jgi:YesN/AraC family two-component response regulator